MEQQLRDKEEELKKKDEQILHLQSLLNIPEDKRLKLEEERLKKVHSSVKALELKLSLVGRKT